jgi:hypothetical protein
LSPPSQSNEQKQVFEGAAHPFYWKPKLRIPDIYENEENKRTFGRFSIATSLSRRGILNADAICASAVEFAP